MFLFTPKSFGYAPEKRNHHKYIVTKRLQKLNQHKNQLLTSAEVLTGILMMTRQPDLLRGKVLPTVINDLLQAPPKAVL